MLVVIPCLGIVIYDIIKLVKSVRKTISPKKQLTTTKSEPNLELIGEDNQVIDKVDLKEKEEDHTSDDDIEVI